MKRCPRCEKVKPLDAFYKSKLRRDSRDFACIECESARKRRRRAAPGGREADRAYRASERGKAANKRGNAVYNARYPTRRKARYTVSNAIASGKIPKPSTLACVDCGHQAEQYHHKSYAADRRLDVEPLCETCHVARRWAAA